MDIEKVLDFIIELDKLKTVLRKSRPVGMDRFENSAEHSWQVCLSALALKDYAEEAIDIDRVIKMLLIHDLGEIDAGDTIVYAQDNEEVKRKEEEGVRRVLSILPGDQSAELFELWLEFESGESPDARFAKAIDRIPPLLQNIAENGRGWHENGIRKEQVFSVNQLIEKGSTPLWDVMRGKLENAVQDGILK